MVQQGAAPSRERSAAGWAYALVAIAHLALIPVSLRVAYESEIRTAIFVVAWVAALVICIVAPGDKGPVSLSHYRFLRRTLIIGGVLFVIAAIAAATLGLTFLASMHSGGPGRRPYELTVGDGGIAGLIGSLGFILLAIAALGFILVRWIFGVIHLLGHHPVAMGRARLAQPTS